MRIALTGLAAAAALTLAIAPIQADPERVVFPAGYPGSFVNYLDVDHMDRKRVRKMYINPQAHDAAKAGEDLPDGTILIMEDHNAKKNADDTLMTDADGRLIGEDAVSNLFVMEKRAGWDTDNGHWEYAWFLPDGSRKADAKFEGCFSCHANRSERDFNFTYSKFVSDQAM